jgi:hypothetical protein
VREIHETFNDIQNPSLDEDKSINQTISLVNQSSMFALCYLCGCFSLLMPYWLVYVSHVEDRFFNTPRL